MKLGYLHYLSNYLYGASGPFVHTQELANACRALGHQVTVLRQGRPEVEGAPLKFRTKRYPAWLGRWLHEPRHFLENVTFFPERGWMRTSRPDCAIIRYGFGRISGGLAARSLGLPWILQVDAPYGLESGRLDAYWHLPGLNQAIEKWLVRSCGAMAVVSRGIYEYYRDRGVPAGKMLLVPNGVDAERFRPGLNGEEIRRRFGLEGRRILGFAGGFYPWHGIEGLCHLMEGLLPRVPDAAILFVGDGPERVRLERCASQNGLERRVVFAGSVSPAEMPQYLASMDIALAPYPAMEHFYFSPLKLFEYLASGRPTVAARIGQVAEVIREGENGLLFAPGDWRDLSRQVERFLADADLRQRCGQQGRQTVLGGYTWRRVAERVMGLAERVVRRIPEPAQGL